MTNIYILYPLSCPCMCLISAPAHLQWFVLASNLWCSSSFRRILHPDLYSGPHNLAKSSVFKSTVLASFMAVHITFSNPRILGSSLWIPIKLNITILLTSVALIIRCANRPQNTLIPLRAYATGYKNISKYRGFYSLLDNWISFNLRNPSSRSVTLGSTQPLSEMSIRNFPGGKSRPARKAVNLTAICKLTV
jgi:hypothetical protein